MLPPVQNRWTSSHFSSLIVICPLSHILQANMLPRSPPSPPLLLPAPPLSPFCRNPNFLLLKQRRRRKSYHHLLSVQSSLNEFITNPSLYLLAPAVSFVSGAAAFFISSRQFRIPGSGIDAIEDWVLFTSPTPFNRSVFLRCPSISFEGDGEFLDGITDNLLKEEKHYVNLRRPEISNKEEYDEDTGLEYQRICIRMKDGGVISLDWPDNLDLRAQYGLDSTLIVVPGTTRGSKEKNIKLFVSDALRHGYFPIVMNPRGCAGSPVTSPRLFTGADSDDINIVIRFVNTLRPWTTLVGVSRGYGSNMLTKYLSEVGESTPLTSAVCMDTIFDLDEATQSIPHRLSLDRELTNGLIDILLANKELFQGKEKGFDIQKGLTAITLRDFDEAISMVSHGCRSLEDFYSKSNIKASVPSIKIPVLFIDSGNGTVPPCTDIKANPFTSLLLLSSLPSGIYTSDLSSIMGCHLLAIEWLSAVEMALLKGRHPLLEDIDISINPSKGLPLVNGKNLKKSRKRHTNSSSSSLILEDKSPVSRYLVGPQVELNSKNGKANNTGEKMEEREEEMSVDAAEESQVLQTASVVMNMLDVTMPGTLDDDKKKKVLFAMGNGETLMRALQDAVPEDVRGKLTVAASEIIQAQKSNISFDALKWKHDNNNNNNNISNINSDDTKVSEITEPSEQPQVETVSEEKVQEESSSDPEPIQEKDLHDAEKESSEDSAESNTVNTPKDDEAKKVDAPNAEQNNTPNAEQNNTPNAEQNNTPNAEQNNTPNAEQNNTPNAEQNNTVNNAPASINVSQAFNALTGFDDSTQMAVNSVFGVIENMIDQFEKKQEDKNNETVTEETKEKSQEDDKPVEKSQDSEDGKSKKETSSLGIVSSEEKKMKKNPIGYNYFDHVLLERAKNMHNANYLDRFVLKRFEDKKEKESGFDSATVLFLDPEEGKWKIVDQARNGESELDNYDELDSVIEPSYVILDDDLSSEEPEESEESEEDNNSGEDNDTTDKVESFIREKLLRALEKELHRKLGKKDLKTVDKSLVYDIEELASFISDKVVLNSELNSAMFSQEDVSEEKIGTIEESFMIKTVSCAVQEAKNLTRLLPVGVIVGSILACLRKYFELSESDDDVETETEASDGEITDETTIKEAQNDNKGAAVKKSGMTNSQRGGIMVGAVTAALGASALLVQHENGQRSEESNSRRTSNQLDDETHEKNNSLISSLAEKAMSVAGPVVPTKGDGGVDHERLVAVLAELGQKGGILRLVGKLALLWGGIRGAMSLTDRLISFFHIGERPFYLRLIGFGGMALILWSPIVIPLLPALVQIWSTRSPSGIVGYACVVGFYVSVTIQIMLWGKRIRGYEDPLRQYGLDMTSTPRLHDFLKGLVGGIVVVLSIQSINVLLGNASFSSSQLVPFFSSSNGMSVFKACGNELVLVARGLITAICISLVEELLFRSWLVEEIAVDYGYYPAFILSGVLFCLIHRSVHSMPGYFVLSLALCGMKQRCEGQLAAPIGMRAGIMTTSYTLHAAGLVRYMPNMEFSSRSMHPFHGVVGLGFCVFLAVVFWPEIPSRNYGDVDVESEESK